MYFSVCQASIFVSHNRRFASRFMIAHVSQGHATRTGVDTLPFSGVLPCPGSPYFVDVIPIGPENARSVLGEVSILRRFRLRLESGQSAGAWESGRGVRVG